MKNVISKIIKKNPYLYRLAKKVYRMIQREPEASVFVDEMVYVGYLLRNFDELDVIEKHFHQLSLSNSSILLIVFGNELDIHSLMPKYSVISFEYFKKYQKKFRPNNVFMLDYQNQEFSQVVKEVL